MPTLSKHEAVRVLQQRMSGAPRKRQAAIKMRPVVTGQIASLASFDHLIGACHGSSRNLMVKIFAALRLSTNSNRVGLLHRNFGRFGTAKYLRHNPPTLTIDVGKARAVCQEAPASAVSGHWNIAGRRTVARRSRTI